MSEHPQPTAATALNDQFLESQNPATQQRVTVAIVRYAKTVSDEADDTPNHQARLRLAEQVARMPQQFVQPFTLLVTAQGFNSQADDGTLGDWITQVWNVMAGRQA